MTIAAPSRRQSVASRRVGYVISALFNAVALYVINVWPGWDAVPFLTADTRQVLGIVNASLIVSLVVNLVYVVHDPPWLKSFGDLVTLGIGLAVLIRLLQVFPVDFTGYSFDWALVIRILLVVGLVGTAIGIVVQLVSLARILAGRPVAGR